MFRCVAILFFFWISLLGQAQAQLGPQETFGKAVDEATQAVGDPNLFDARVAALLALLPQTPEGYYIVDGDIRMTEPEIRQMVRDRQSALKGVAPWPDSAKQGELIVITENGVPTCYRSAAERRLTYAIDKASFAAAPDQNAFETIRQELQAATADWENACPECGIRFEPETNTSPRQGDVNFIVRYVGDRGSLIASAFFPKDVPSKRYVDIALGYYTAGYDRVGVLRHELGHVLGYRHEHVRPEIPFQCVFEREDRRWTQISDTKYDKFSVMHYPCVVQGQLLAGSSNFVLTSEDKAAHKKFYAELCR
jgi:predicted Zn-dependent protease